MAQNQQNPTPFTPPQGPLNWPVQLPTNPTAAPFGRPMPHAPIPSNPNLGKMFGNSYGGDAQ